MRNFVIKRNTFRFDNEIDVVSVRTGGKNDKYSCKSFARIHNPAISLGTWNCRVLVEEPFNRTNVARLLKQAKN